MTGISKPKLTSKSCTKCSTFLTGNSYYPTKSQFFADGLLPICKMCLAVIVDLEDWASMDKFCQWADYPFLPEVWTKLVVELGAKALDAYVKAYTTSTTYEFNDWRTAHDEWARILKTGEYRDKIPNISEARIADLAARWGSNYDKEDLLYLEKFFTDLCAAHNIITPTQEDAARTLAKLSVRISQRISDGADIDKDISSYDKEMKIGGFTTENVRNMSDFESVGELFAYLEKTGWKNAYYDGVAKDIVDETITNIQSFLRRIVMSEPNLKDTVDKRLTSIGLNKTGDLNLSDADFDKYDNDGFNEVEAIVKEETEEMIVDET